MLSSVDPGEGRLGVTYVVQVNVDIVQAVRHLQSFFVRDALADDSLVIKSMLTEAFGGPVLRPWAVHAVRDAQVIVVGYAAIPAEEANERRGLALPSVQASVGLAVGAALPDLRDGHSYRFAVRLVPTIRITKKETGSRYGERDAFLVQADGVGVGAGLTRDAVYKQYLVERLPGAEISEFRLFGFRLMRFARPLTGGGWGRKTMPEALLAGSLKVTERDALTATITRGIGRQRAYGYGMLRLKPERPFTPLVPSE